MENKNICVYTYSCGKIPSTLYIDFYVLSTTFAYRQIYLSYKNTLSIVILPCWNCLTNCDFWRANQRWRLKKSINKIYFFRSDWREGRLPKGVLWIFLVLLWFGALFDEQTTEQTLKLTVIWDAIMLMWHHCDETFASLYTALKVHWWIHL